MAIRKIERAYLPKVVGDEVKEMMRWSSHKRCFLVLILSSSNNIVCSKLKRGLNFWKSKVSSKGLKMSYLGCEQSSLCIGASLTLIVHIEDKSLQRN